MMMMMISTPEPARGCMSKGVVISRVPEIYFGSTGILGLTNYSILRKKPIDNVPASINEVLNVTLLLRLQLNVKREGF